jgi:AcrR family transcriptional regulator
VSASFVVRGGCLHDRQWGADVATFNEQAFLKAALSGCTLADIAKASGISVSSVQRRLKDEDVVRAMREARAELRSQVIHRLGQARLQAVDKLVELLDSSKEPVALRAAQVVIDLAVRGEDKYDLEARLAALEALPGEGA